MNRWLFALNVVLFSVLLVQVTAPLRRETGLSARGLPRLLAKDLKLIELDADGGSWLLDFGVPMVAPECVGTNADPELLKLEPKARLTARWKREGQLEIRTEGTRRATAYRLHLDPACRSLSGRAVPTDVPLLLETPRVKVVGALPVGDPEEPRDFLLTFDLPVAATDVAKALSVCDSGGDALAVDVLPVPGEETTVKVVAKDRDLRPVSLRLRLAAEFKPRTGDLDLGVPFERLVSFTEPLAVAGVRGTPDGIRIEFNHDVPRPLAGKLRVEPGTPHQVLTNWQGLLLVGEFAPGSTVAVVLEEGFPGVGTWRLAERVRRSVRLPDRTPSLSFPRRGSVLSSKARPEIEVAGINVASYQLSVRTVYPNNVVRWAQSRGRLPDTVFGPARELTRSVAAARNEAFEDRVDLREVLGENPVGLHEVTLSDPAGRAWGGSRLFQITDLGVTVRAAGNRIAAHVTSLSRGQGLSKATVRVHSTANQVLGTGTTDDDGTVTLELESKDPYVVEVVLEKDRTFVDLDGFAVPLARDTFAGRPYLAEALEAEVSWERGVFRPGEPLRGSVVVRDGEGRSPVGREVELRWLAPGHRLRKSVRWEVDATGLLAFTHPTDPDGATGTWTLEVREQAREPLVGRGMARVETYVPDRLEAAVTVEGALVFGGEALVTVKARWLEGPVARDLPGTLHVRFDHGSFRPNGHEDFGFGRETDTAPPGARPPVKFALDAQGEATVRLALPKDATSQVLEARFHVEVQDPSGRAVRAAHRAPVHRDGGHLGVMPTDRGITVFALDAGGRRMPGEREVRVRWERRWWGLEVVAHRSRQRFESRIQREVLAESTLVLQGGLASWEHAPPSIGEGWLLAVVEAEGVVSEKAKGEVPSSPHRLQVEGPSDPVTGGSTAHLVVTSPVAGRLFVTLESTTIHATSVVTVKAGSNDVPVLVPEGLSVPNIYAVATLTAPQAVSQAQGPFWLVGGACLALAHPERRAMVAIDAPDAVAPLAEFPVGVTVPGARRALVSVVDAGILRLTDHPVPDPAAWFSAQRRLEGRGMDTGIELLDGVRFDDGVLTGGGDGDDGVGARLRGTTSQWLETLALTQVVELDAQGHGRATFKLPEFEGRARISVIAAGARVVGGSARDVKVASTLGLRVANPRFMAPGDTTAVAVTVRNGDAEPRDVLLTLESVGGAAVLDSPERRVSLAPGALETLHVRLKAGSDAGVQGLRCRARLGEHARDVTARFDVRPLGSFDVVDRGVLALGRETVTLPGTWLEGTRARWFLGGGPDLQMLPLLEALRAYPHGCVEQTTSRCRAVLACRALWSSLYPEGDGPDTEEMLVHGIDRLVAMQLPQGGLAWWPGSTAESDVGTLQALEFLADAAAEGIPVPEAFMDRVRSRARWFLEEGASSELRCLAAQALSRAGAPMSSWLGRLSEEVDDAAAAYRLALVYGRQGRTEEARALMARAQELGSTHQSLWTSKVILDALKLETLLEVAPGDPGIAAQSARLQLEARDPRRLTTQELGWVARALGRTFALQKRAAANVSGATLRVGEHSWQVALGRALEIPIVGGEEVVIDVEGSGTLFGHLRIMGLRTDVSERDDLGLKLTRRLLDIDTGEPVAQCQRGQVYDVVLEGTLTRPLEHLALTDVLPGGFELEPLAPRSPNILGETSFDRRELRDDRILLFRVASLTDRLRASYRVRAVFPGSYAGGHATAEALYEPGLATRCLHGSMVTIVP